MEEPSADTLVDEHQDATYTTQKWKCKSRRFVSVRPKNSFNSKADIFHLKIKCIEQQTKEKEIFHRTEFSSDRIYSTIGYQQFEQISVVFTTFSSISSRRVTFRLHELNREERNKNETWTLFLCSSGIHGSNRYQWFIQPDTSSSLQLPLDFVSLF